MATNGSGTYMGPVPVFTADNGLELRYGETPAIGTGYSMRGLPVGSRTPGIRTMMDVDGTKTSFDPMGKIVDQSGPFSMEQSSPSRIVGGSSFGSSSFGSSSFGASPFYSSSMPFDPRVYGGNGFETASAGASTKSDTAATAQMGQLLNGFGSAAKKAADSGDLGGAGMFSSQATQASDLYQDQIAAGMNPGSAWESVRAVSTAFGGDFSHAKDNLAVLQRMANRRGVSLTEMGQRAAEIRDIFGPVIVGKNTTVDLVGHTSDAVSQLMQTFDDYETRNNGRHLSIDGLTRIKNNVIALKSKLATDANSFQFSDTDWVQASIYQSGDHTTYGNQKPLVLQYDEACQRDAARIGFDATKSVKNDKGEIIQVPVETSPVDHSLMKSFVQSIRSSQLASRNRNLNVVTDEQKSEAVSNLASTVMNRTAFPLNDPDGEAKQKRFQDGLTQICSRLADSLVKSDGRPLDFVGEFQKLFDDMFHSDASKKSSPAASTTNPPDASTTNPPTASTTNPPTASDAQASSSPEDWGPRIPRPWRKDTSYDPLDLHTHQYLAPSVDDEIKSKLPKTSLVDSDFFSVIDKVYQSGGSDAVDSFLTRQTNVTLKKPEALGSLGDFGIQALNAQSAKTHDELSSVWRKTEYIRLHNPEGKAKNAMSSCVNLLRFVKPFVDIGLVKADEITELLKPVTDMCSETGLIMPADPKSVLSDSYKTYDVPVMVHRDEGHPPIIYYSSLGGLKVFQAHKKQAELFADQMIKLNARLSQVDHAYQQANGGHLKRLMEGVSAVADYAVACRDRLQYAFPKYEETTYDYSPDKSYLSPAAYKSMIQSVMGEGLVLDSGEQMQGLEPLKQKLNTTLHDLQLDEDEPVAIARQIQKMTSKDKQEKQ